MARKVAEKELKTNDLEQAAIDFKDFVKMVQQEHPNAKISIVIKN